MSWRLVSMVAQAVSFSGDAFAKHRSWFRNASESGMPGV